MTLHKADNSWGRRFFKWGASLPNSFSPHANLTLAKTHVIHNLASPDDDGIWGKVKNSLFTNIGKVTSPPALFLKIPPLVILCTTLVKLHTTYKFQTRDQEIFFTPECSQRLCLVPSPDGTNPESLMKVTQSHDWDLGPTQRFPFPPNPVSRAFFPQPRPRKATTHIYHSKRVPVVPIATIAKSKMLYEQLD